MQLKELNQNAKEIWSGKSLLQTILRIILSIQFITLEIINKKKIIKKME